MQILVFFPQTDTFQPYIVLSILLGNCLLDSYQLLLILLIFVSIVVMYHCKTFRWNLYFSIAGD